MKNELEKKVKNYYGENQNHLTVEGKRDDNPNPNPNPILYPNPIP